MATPYRSLLARGSCRPLLPAKYVIGVRVADNAPTSEGVHSDSSQRELQGEMLGLDRSRRDLAQSLPTDGSNNMALAILMAERRAQDDLRACFNEVAPGQDVPASCKRVRRCREAANILRAP
jgi:hypothetical protein